jgi:hypothetical protein
VSTQVRLLTIYDNPHILDETVYDLESLSRVRPSLVLRESVQPLQDRFNVLFSETFLYEFDCVVLSKVTQQRERTHLIDLA